MRSYSAATSDGDASDIIQNAERGWVTQEWTVPRWASISSGSIVILIGSPP
jgi:hypothetical protein